MEMTSRVFLVGFMGSGKSTLGKLIAAELGFSFLDLDEAIEEKYHNTISEIFSLHGEQVFGEFEKIPCIALKPILKSSLPLVEVLHAFMTICFGC
ncbi:MAG: hypothetical protein IPL56_20755 [Saprospiraceae bacterium]|nr:hypothetical protein [Saprospiraceae bacterium]